MWNRQREAQMAREILAEVGDEEPAAPNRNPPEASEAVATVVDTQELVQPLTLRSDVDFRHRHLEHERRR